MERDNKGKFIKTLSIKDKVKLCFFGGLMIWAFIGAFTAPSVETVYPRPAIDKEVQTLIDSRVEYAKTLPQNAKLSSKEIEYKVVNAINILTTY